MIIRLPDNKEIEFDGPVTGLDIARMLSKKLEYEALSITVNNEVWDLTRPITFDATIKINTWDDDEGKETFWHSSAHLMAHAIEILYPGTKFGIGPAIENGFYYDIELPQGKTLSENDFPAIEAKMKELAQKKIKIERREVSKAEAIKYFSAKNDDLKLELINELEEDNITFYEQENFTDLCRGPHLPHTGYIKAIKILSIAGAYWRGDASRKQLTRVYGITFPQQKMLDEYLKTLEEAKKRDHRKIGRELELFFISQNVGIGLPIWLPKGTIIRNNLELLLRKIQKDYNYQTVITPHIGNKQLYVTSGHYEKYKESSFRPISTPQEGEEYMLKPMNCPHHCEIYNSKLRSYRELPLRLAEFGTVYRYEQSGELHGLTRVRGFTQDDAHIFCTPAQLKDEFLKVMEIILYIFKIFKFENYMAQISLRDPKNTEKYIGSEENWENAEKAIIEAVEESGIQAKKVIGEAAFYGPKLDFMVKDAIGRKWQLGTIQVDYNLPERFNLEYIGEDNQPHRPVMIHRAPFGSLERFVALLIEHTGGKFPLWLTPDQVAVLPISEKYKDFAKNLVNLLKNNDIRVLFDDRDEKIGKKIRDAEVKHIPIMAIVGENEVKNNTVSMRIHGKGDMGSLKIEEFINYIKTEIENSLK
ncbi:MAG: threonine--tRNA ligase [Bacteroidales bacterium]|nr:threonine--tRNA ligase [Bacteroidales bacterium]